MSEKCLNNLCRTHDDQLAPATLRAGTRSICAGYTINLWRWYTINLQRRYTINLRRQYTIILRRRYTINLRRSRFARVHNQFAAPALREGTQSIVGAKKNLGTQICFGTQIFFRTGAANCLCTLAKCDRRKLIVYRRLKFIIYWRRKLIMYRRRKLIVYQRHKLIKYLAQIDLVPVRSVGGAS